MEKVINLLYIISRFKKKCCYIMWSFRFIENSNVFVKIGAICLYQNNMILIHFAFNLIVQFSVLFCLLSLATLTYSAESISFSNRFLRIPRILSLKEDDIMTTEWQEIQKRNSTLNLPLHDIDMFIFCYVHCLNYCCSNNFFLLAFNLVFRSCIDFGQVTNKISQIFMFVKPF